MAGRSVGKSYINKLTKLYHLQKRIGLVQRGNAHNMAEYTADIIDYLKKAIDEADHIYSIEELKFILKFIDYYEDKDNLTIDILTDSHTDNFIEAEKLIFKYRIGEISNDKSNTSM
jgi:hypothetical protein